MYFYLLLEELQETIKQGTLNMPLSCEHTTFVCIFPQQLYRGLSIILFLSSVEITT